jgi:hypothetical protein
MHQAVGAVKLSRWGIDSVTRATLLDLPIPLDAVRRLGVPLKYLEYKGMTIKAGAFEFNSEGRYVSILSIARNGAGGEQGSVKLFDPPCPDDLFSDADEALDAAITHGRAIVDGEVPGAHMEDS